MFCGLLLLAAKFNTFVIHSCIITFMALHSLISFTPPYITFNKIFAFCSDNAPIRNLAERLQKSMSVWSPEKSTGEHKPLI